MINLLGRYHKLLAYTLFFIFYSTIVLPVYASHRSAGNPRFLSDQFDYKFNNNPAPVSSERINSEGATNIGSGFVSAPAKKSSPLHIESGGPTQPEMSTFKSVGADNMVNLFTGDFSYNIPLMDVGGYPINLFYDGGVTMEQEASWVGLGWNINPGNIQRNMRGVPDDFDGTDKLIQRQEMKPNTTTGASINADLELVGIKDVLGISLGGSLGVSMNSYLGPALDIGTKGGLTFKLATKSATEKLIDSVTIGVGLSANLSSRYGVTVSPNSSISTLSFLNNGKISTGLSISTSYNSRNGIKALNINEQASFNTRINKRSFSGSGGVYGTTISFAKPTYIPALRVPVTNSSYAGRFQLGGAIFGVYASGEIEVYRQQSSIEGNDVRQEKPLIGYLHYEIAAANPNAVMDFTRFNDKEVTSKTPVISAPQYAYDVFSIQGEGTGGSIRLYRNDIGYVRDNFTKTNDESLSAGVDIGIPGHVGANVNKVKTPSTIGEWARGNKLKTAIGFKPADKNYENVYFRNPGESSVLDDNQYNAIGGTDLVRFRLGGVNSSPTIEPILDRISQAGYLVGNTSLPGSSMPNVRKKRTQLVSYFTAAEASKIGLDKTIKNYDNEVPFDNNNILKVSCIPRTGGFRKPRHISQINVTEADGKRYIYGIPVYNVLQKDFTFSVEGNGPAADIVSYPEQRMKNLLNQDGIDGYLQITETPAYAHSFLLSGLLSPGYVDVNDDGITEDDLGDAVKFNYSMIMDGTSPLHYKWRTPMTKDANTAHLNAGNRAEKKDDKGIVSYGERESWYMHSIESKSMIALFKLEDRLDAKSVSGENGGTNANDKATKRLKQIDLYNKADLKANGIAGAKPIKSVHFSYSYKLCANTPDNVANSPEGTGKLTLDNIYFTFNGKSRQNKNQYVFGYSQNLESANPAHEYGASDRWGNYKAAVSNPASVKNSDYPYSLQDKAIADQNAAAWSLRKILLPSGGQVEVEYEADDYAFVQNKRAAVMLPIVGFGNTNTSMSDKLYDVTALSIKENNYVFVKIPEPCTNDKCVYEKYLDGISQLAFKIAVYMPKGEIEYVQSYATIKRYGKFDNDHIWIEVNLIDGLSPLSLTAVEFLREQLPGQAFPGYDLSESDGLEQAGNMLIGMLSSMRGAFTNPLKFLRQQGMARTAALSKSFIRLNDPDGYKLGGGQRVKRIKLNDNWNRMTTQYNSVYGKEYDYTTQEHFNGTERVISSGVASYEPSIGGEENPFQTIMQIANTLPLGPTSYGAVEMPVLDAFFPSPLVGYSKVTVRSIKRELAVNKKSRSGTGKQVNEFYTAKDYPVYYSHSAIDPNSEKTARARSMMAFFYKYSYDSRALSQGFLIATNDMHGKMKSQSSYAENDDKTRITYTENFYKNTGEKGLSEKFDFVHAAEGGAVRKGNMGIDIELMIDTREFSIKSSSLEIQAQMDLFPVVLPFWLPFIWPVDGDGESTYRAVTVTKVINYHSVLDKVVVIDKGSQVSTENLVYDSETGQVVINRTNNEFDEPVYSTSYPAYWAYSGMGPGYRNINATYSGVQINEGKITGGIPDMGIFESGDELLIISSDPPSAICNPDFITTSADVIWAFDKNKNSGSLTNGNPDFYFIDKKGLPFSAGNVSFRIVRSGKRNMLGERVATVTSLVSPVVANGSNFKMAVSNASRAVNASAVEFREKWQTDRDIVNKYKSVFNDATCTFEEVIDCNGYFDLRLNPYTKGLLGNFRSNRSLIFYGTRNRPDPLKPVNLTTPTTLAKNGALEDFKLYWDFSPTNNLVPDVQNPKWVWNSQVTLINGRGMELETKNALNIYTAAQYGFHKNSPVAIANNSRYNEIVNAGFEDESFNQNINNNNSQTACARPAIAFDLANGTPATPVEATGFSAHTGRYVMGIPVQSNIEATVPVVSTINDAFQLNFGSETSKSLINPGGNHSFATQDPGGTIQYADIQFSHNSPSITVKATPVDKFLNGVRFHHYSIDWDFYFVVTEKKSYNFSASLTTAYNNTGITVQTHTNGIGAIIYDALGNYKGRLEVGQNGFEPTSNSTSVELCPGIYRVVGSITERYAAPNNDFNNTVNNYSWQCTNSTSSTYKSLTTQNGCTSLKPIQVDETMLNPAFSLLQNKEMLVSAWVKGGTSPASSPVTVQVDFGPGNTPIPAFSAKGPIIEGWQRVEGRFTVPQGASTMKLRILNSGSQNAYVDDIRIHPFNANMKSYVYDPVNLRLSAELDENNYASFYEYDEEGTLVRVKKETIKGIKTLQETRSAKQTTINTIQ